MQINKTLLFDTAARKEILDGVETIAKAVKSTMGPNGQTVVIEREGAPPILTKDGVTVAHAINLSDKFKNLGVQMVKQAAAQTAEEAGDGTTTSTVLTHALTTEGMKLVAAGYKSSEIRSGMEWAVKEILKDLETKAQPVREDEDIINIGAISSNGDKKIGKLLLQAMKSVGPDGVISIEEAKGFNTSLNTVDGFQLDRGYISPYFVTNHDKLSVEFSNPKILLANKTISSVAEMLPLLEQSHKNSVPLVIIANDVDGEALKTLVVNNSKGIVRACVIRAPEFGDGRVDSMNDLSLLFKTKVVFSGEEIPQSLEDLGTCERIEVFRSRSIFVGPSCEDTELQERISNLQEMISSPETEVNQKMLLARRLNRLQGGIAVIRVGGYTELELRERKDRVEDALHATQAAAAKGILPGGGIALVRSSREVLEKLDDYILPSSTQDFKAGIKVVMTACEAPLRQIVSNSGGAPDVVFNRALNPAESDEGFDARKGEFVNMYKQGIIDPYSVVSAALKNACSAACSIISVGCAMVEESGIDKL